MIRSSPTATKTSDRLTAIIEDYLSAQEAGTAPDKNVLLAEHPDLADDLEACLASLEFIGAAPELRVAKPDRSTDLRVDREVNEVRAALGDYKIVREIGRGGMGVVYLAEQISLGRRIALKVLPFAAVLDPRRLVRFKNEARAAAHLIHQNIVPVHSVGCERGVHYFAMQFIEGQTLADMIAQLRPARAQGADAGAPDRATAISGLTRQLASGKFAPSEQPSDYQSEQLLVHHSAYIDHLAIRFEKSERTDRFNDWAKSRVASMGIRTEGSADRKYVRGLHHRNGKSVGIDVVLDLFPRNAALHTDGLLRFIKRDHFVEHCHIQVHRTAIKRMPALTVFLSRDGYLRSEPARPTNCMLQLVIGLQALNFAHSGLIQSTDIVENQRIFI